MARVNRVRLHRRLAHQRRAQWGNPCGALALSHGLPGRPNTYLVGPALEVGRACLAPNKAVVCGDSRVGLRLLVHHRGSCWETAGRPYAIKASRNTESDEDGVDLELMSPCGLGINQVVGRHRLAQTLKPSNRQRKVKGDVAS